MRLRYVSTMLILLVVIGAPLAAVGEPEANYPEAHRDTALDVIAEHDQTTIAYEVFGDEFAEAIDTAPRHAFFVPTDAALEDWDPEQFTNEELQVLVRRHIAVGSVAEGQIEFVDSFMTMDGQAIEVALDPEGRPVLNGTVTVLETIDVAYGVVYIIDGRLDDETLESERA